MVSESSSDAKIKLLVCGSAKGKLKVLEQKLQKLNSSKAGPFDLCICIGSFFKDDNSEKEEDKIEKNDNEVETIITNIKFPIPVYITSRINCNSSEKLKETVITDNIISLGNNNNLFCLKDPDDNGLNILELPHETSEKSKLKVSWMSQHALFKKENPNNLEINDVDLFISNDWGQGLASSDAISDLDKQFLFGANEELEAIGSFDVSQFVTFVQPRYHFAPALKPHYRFIASTPFLTDENSPPCRFISLSNVSDTKKVPKEQKFLHALSLSPCSKSSSTTNTNEATDVLPTPYAPIHQTKKRSFPNTNNVIQEGEQAALDSSNSCLFLHGLARDTNNLIGPPTLLQAFQSFGCTKVTIPPNQPKRYAFIEFRSHACAKDCLEFHQGSMTIAGVTLSLKWRTANNNSHHNHQIQNQTMLKRRRIITESEASHSTQLYVRIPKIIPQEEYAESFEIIRKFLQTILEDVVNSENNQEESTPNITAEDEPALCVTLRTTANPKDSYAFCCFASHAAASMAIASVTNSIDGGSITDHEKLPQTNLQGTFLYWAVHNNNEQKQNANTLHHEQKKLSIDSCWFCLTNPNILHHLIIQKFQRCYLAIPRGPVNPFHLLIIPTSHHSEGVFTHDDVSSVLSIKKLLQQFSQKILRKGLFTFERAFETRRGLVHSHLQCIPLDPHELTNLETTIQTKAAQLGLDFQLSNDSDIITNFEKEGSCQYFYLDIPQMTTHDATEIKYKQLIMLPDKDSTKITFPPMQFGREIVADILGSSELANWKNCLLTEDEERNSADSYRKSLEEFLSQGKTTSITTQKTIIPKDEDVKTTHESAENNIE